MKLRGKTILSSNEFLPFNTTLQNWAVDGSSYEITYNDTTRHFTIPRASENDYYILWHLTLKTASVPHLPIFSLEFTYNNITSPRYTLAPLSTLQVFDCALYHVQTVSSDDLLTVGLKAIGDKGFDYTLDTISVPHITANLIILGL